jgi:hypothetical protein
LSRWVTAIAGLALVIIIAGCMSLSFGEKSVTYAPVPSDGVAFAQEGKAALPAGGSRVIYYPVPYASIPNLSILNDENEESEELAVVEQAPDHFKVCNNSHFFARSGRWVARGVRPLPPPAPPAVLAPPASPAGPELPARPMPAEEKGAPAK